MGPYEVLSRLGAGGMGEVYRARDPRLHRDVALKMLSEGLADRHRLKRFEQEARAASMLNHPNIVTVFEIGESEGDLYMAMELIEGQTLRQLLRPGGMPLRKLLDVAVQIARGLECAHEAGIVHRDLKPDNVMVTPDGLAKILDFGLAKLTRSPLERGAAADEGTLPLPTQPGALVGTVRYMSPEQAGGSAADFRSDQFAFGSMLYEMATGLPAFERATTVDTLAAILHDEPQPIFSSNPRVPAPLRWIIERCLAKEPRSRYAATADLTRDLASLRDRLSEANGSASAFEGPGKAARGWAGWRGAAVVAFASAAVFALLWARSAGQRHRPPEFRQLTFRVGEVHAARFAPDEQTIVYSAEWQRAPSEIFLHRLGNFESRSFGISDSRLHAVSSSGEMLLSIKGTLARIGMASAGAPREIISSVVIADWSPDAKDVAVVRDVDGHSTLEYPIGHRVFQEPAGWISHIRVSRDGRDVAVVDHPVLSDMDGRILLVDRAGHVRVLTERFNFLWGLAWSADGREVWFTGSPQGGNQVLYAVDRAGRMRLLSRTMGSMVVMDVSPSGRALIADRKFSDHVRGCPPGADVERDLTWLDLSLSRDISADGRFVLMLESGEGGGEGNSVFVRPTDGSPAIRLGDGDPWSFSPDAKSVAAFVRREGHPALAVYPVGSGDVRLLPLSGLEPQWAQWMPDGRQIAVSAGEPGRDARMYLVDFGHPSPRAVGPSGYRTYEHTVSPDGRFVVAQDARRRFILLPLDGGTEIPIPGIASSDVPRGWTADGKFLYVTGHDYTVPRRVDLVRVADGSRTLWKELGPSTGAVGIHVAADGRSYVYTYAQSQADLYQVEGLD